MTTSIQGLVSVISEHSVEATADKLEAILGGKGMNVFARIDHAKAAQSVGEQLRPTVLIIFGNPTVGTKLMQCAQSSAIDLPMKALIAENEQGDVTLSYNSADYMQSRHQISGCDPVIEKVTGALAAFAAAATS